MNLNCDNCSEVNEVLPCSPLLTAHMTPVTTPSLERGTAIRQSIGTIGSIMPTRSSFIASSITIS